jgi:hypothetical protein
MSNDIEMGKLKNRLVAQGFAQYGRKFTGDKTGIWVFYSTLAGPRG